jgi:hypothetical protein
VVVLLAAGHDHWWEACTTDVELWPHKRHLRHRQCHSWSPCSRWDAGQQSHLAHTRSKRLLLSHLAHGRASWPQGSSELCCCCNRCCCCFERCCWV